MLDCWMAFDVEFTVRMAERLRPYGLKWIEDYLIPEDMDGFAEVRSRLPWQTLATGEHWYTPQVFSHAAAKRLADIFQPDINWSGGVTGLLKICPLAEAAGIPVIPHAGHELSLRPAFRLRHAELPLGRIPAAGRTRHVAGRRQSSFRACPCRRTGFWCRPTRPDLAWTSRSTGSTSAWLKSERKWPILGRQQQRRASAEHLGGQQ